MPGIIYLEYFTKVCSPKCAVVSYSYLHHIMYPNFEETKILISHRGVIGEVSAFQHYDPVRGFRGF